MKAVEIMMIATLGIGVAIGQCNAATLTLKFDSVFSGTAPGAASPWLGATFTDVAGGVQLEIEASGLLPSEGMKEIYFNLDPLLSPVSVTFAHQSGRTATVSRGLNQFKADGDGRYDFLLDFGSGASNFRAGEQSRYLLSGPATLSATAFNYFSQPAGGNGPFVSAAHVQGTGPSALDSGWVSGMAQVPLPGALLMLGSGLGLAGAFLRKRARPQPRPVARKRSGRKWNTTGALAIAGASSLLSSTAWANPKVIVISLDGANPRIVRQYLDSGVLPADQGLGLLRRKGTVALRNITATPSLTAVSHIAIATGSTAVHNDIPGNTFKLVVSPTGNTISGFAAPIGGYDVHGLAPSATPSALPLWIPLREAGKKVVTATWPGGDGIDVRAPGVTGAPLLQSATPTRVVDYTVPFGAFGGLGAQGFSSLTTAGFGPDAGIELQLANAGRVSYSPVQVTLAPVETLWCPPAGTTGTCGTTSSATRTVSYLIRAAAVDASDDGAVNYDMLVFFDANRGIQPGPFALPATGPAYARAGGPSAKFFFEGTENRIGTAWFVSHLTPDLSSVRFARYAANFIPRNAPVLASVDDINQNVGFWAPQSDFRIPERVSPGFAPFPDAELEAMYQDQVRTFVDYQTRVGLRAIARNPDADLVMIYIEQPDGAGHQFTLTDPRQTSDFTNPLSIGTPGNPAGAIGQDPDKIARYASYLRFSYQQASEAVQRIIEATGLDAHGAPESNIIVVSDHGMAHFHTAVNLTNLLRNAGIDLTRVRITTSGPSTNIYVNLVGREQGSNVDLVTYASTVEQIKDVLKRARDTNAIFSHDLRHQRIFSEVRARPLDCARPGLCTNEHIGQDFGDVFAILAEGYNFDGTQSPGVTRMGDATFDASVSVFSVPNFYGAHGYPSELPAMSAILFAAGPNIRRGVTLKRVENIDIAPTVMKILGVDVPITMDGHPLKRMLKTRHD